jgi:hypothetical protein
MIPYFKKNRKLLAVAVLFFLVQLPFLDQLSLLRGERDIMLSGYSLAKTGADLYGKFLSLEFLGIDPYVPFFPMYAAALWWLLVPFKSVFTARLLFVLISAAIPFLVHEIVKHITDREDISFFTAVVFVFSPGVFHLTRLTLEIGIAFPLLLGGILAFQKKKRLLSYALLFLSFFSYHGFRPLIPVLLVYLSFFEYFKSRNIKVLLKQTAVHVLFFGLLVGLSFFIDGRLMKSRINDVAFSNFERWSNEVIYRRNTSIAPKAVTAAFDNKLTAMVQYMRDVFFNGFDLGYLFIKGDDSSLYATTFTGQFFITFSVFYLLGLFFIAKKAKWNYYYLASIIFVGLVPSIANISYVSYSIRSILSSVGHAFLIACGIVFFLQWVVKANVWSKRIAVLVLALSLSAELVYFGYNYYGRRFITMSEMYFENERQIAKYLIDTRKPYRIYAHSPRDIFFSYLFFNNRIDMKQAQAAARQGEPYRIGNLEIHKCPVNPKYTFRNEIIMDSCVTEKQYQKLAGERKYSAVIPYSNYSFRDAFFIFD